MNAKSKNEEGRFEGGQSRQSVAQGKHDALTAKMIGVFYDVYNELGYGFVEVMCRESMRLALAEAGLRVSAEVPVPVSFRGHTVGVFRADLIVEESVLLELKTSEQLVRQHESQTLHYLRSTAVEVALLMNFGPTPRFKRFAMDNEKKRSRERSVESAGIGVDLSGAREVAS